MAEGGAERASFGKLARNQTKYGTNTKATLTNETYLKHVIRPGDTLQGVALKYATTVSPPSPKLVSFTGMAKHKPPKKNHSDENEVKVKPNLKLKGLLKPEGLNIFPQNSISELTSALGKKTPTEKEHSNF